jgi:2-polyprenyl-6-methoxyphenol hydroxylase-like FAD-dependent oxidoreductase
MENDTPLFSLYRPQQTAATVVGAGIAGPAAALVLADSGDAVTVYDARPEHELVSDGIIGITQANVDSLTNLGVSFSAELPNTFTEWDTHKTRTSAYHYITWTDMHLALVDAARAAGATFEFAHKVDKMPHTAIVILASGIGSASQVSTPAYTGYVVIRGLAPQFAGTAWTTVRGTTPNGKPWLFNVGDTHEGASFEFFVARDAVSFRTTYSAVAPAETAELPAQFAALLKSTPIFQQAPMSDWTVPRSMMAPHGAYRIGDALGQLRPQTSMGANLGIQEALAINSLMLDDLTEADLLADRRRWYAFGIQAGIQRGKFGK